MKLQLIFAAATLIAANTVQAQDTQYNTEKTTTTVVTEEVRIARHKQDASFAKEQRKLQKQQDKLAKKEKKFEKKQSKISKAERKLAQERKRRDKYQSQYDKDLAKYSKQMAQGKMSPDDIAKWEVKRRKYQENIQKSAHKMEDADKRVRSLRE